jgi:hypothetical protein
VVKASITPDSIITSASGFPPDYTMLQIEVWNLKSATATLLTATAEKRGEDD